MVDSPQHWAGFGAALFGASCVCELLCTRYREGNWWFVKPPEEASRYTLRVVRQNIAKNALNLEFHTGAHFLTDLGLTRSQDIISA